jgi:chromosome segregation ATPase
MRQLFIGVILVLLGISVYWNYKTSKSVQTQEHKLQQIEESVEEAQKNAAEEAAALRARQVNTRSSQQQKMDQLTAQLQVERTLLKNIGDEVNQTRTSATNQTSLVQVNKEIAAENEVIRSLNAQVHDQEQEVAASQRQGSTLSQEQKDYRRRQDTDLNTNIQTYSNQVKIDQQQLAVLTKQSKRPLADTDIYDRVTQAQNQLQSDQATLAQLKDQKAQFSNSYTSQKQLSDAEVANYKRSLQDNLANTRNKRDDEKAKLATMTRGLGDLKGGENGRTQALNRLNSQYQDQAKKVQELEQQLREQRDVLNTLTGP